MNTFCIPHAPECHGTSFPFDNGNLRFVVHHTQCDPNHNRAWEAKALWIDDEPDSDDSPTPYEKDPLQGEELPPLQGDDTNDCLLTDFGASATEPLGIDWEAIGFKTYGMRGMTQADCDGFGNWAANEEPTYAAQSYSDCTQGA